MRATRRASIGVQPLEGRALQSGGGHAPGRVAALVAPRMRVLPLSGHVDGVYTVAPSLAAPSPAVVHASGRVSPMGKADLSGVITALPTMANAHLDLILSNRRGSLQLSLGPDATPINPSVSPFHLRYSIVSGSGAYRYASGTGTALVSLQPDAGTLGTTGGFQLFLRHDLR